jgi:hypothetical protein
VVLLVLVDEVVDDLCSAIGKGDTVLSWKNNISKFELKFYDLRYFEFVRRSEKYSKPPFHPFKIESNISQKLPLTWGPSLTSVLEWTLGLPYSSNSLTS